MSTAKLNGGAADAAIAAAQLERRLAKSTVFADANPHLRIVPTTSNPAPLGFFAFAFCGALYVSYLTGWIPKEGVPTIYAFFFTFAGIGMIITGLLEYQRKNVFACNAFLCYSFFFLGTALKGTLQGAGIWKHDAKAEQASFILWGLVTLAFWVQTLVLNLALCSLFLTLAILLFCLAAMQTHPSMTHGTGAFGLFVCALAFYNGAAGLTQEIWGRELLPVGHIKWAAIRRHMAKPSSRFGPAGTKRPLGDFDLEAPSPSSVDMIKH